jgi:hypothetical protein
MARAKTSVNRKDNLRTAFKQKVGQVLTAKEVEKIVGASYWRATVRDLKNEGMNIESVRDGREVIGYKLVSGKSAGAKKGAEVTASVVKAGAGKTVTKPAATKTATKKDTSITSIMKDAVKEVRKEEAVAASKSKTKTKPKAAKAVTKKALQDIVLETPADEADPDVLAILRQVGL